MATPVGTQPGPAPQAQYAYQAQAAQNAQPANPALGGPSYVNSDDGARIFSNGPAVAVESITGNTVTYIAPTDSFMLQRYANGERIGSLGNGSGTIGLDQGNVEVAVDPQRNVKVLGPDGKWQALGSIQSQVTQQQLLQLTDQQALSDLNNVVAHNGALGGIDMRGLGFAESSIRTLADAQEMNRADRLRTQQAAAQAQIQRRINSMPPTAPIIPIGNQLMTGLG